MGEGSGVRADRGSETLGAGAPESAPGIGVRCTADGGTVPAVSTGADGGRITSRSIALSGSAASALLTKRSNASPAGLGWSPLSRKGGRGMGEGTGVRADRGSETFGAGALESAPGIGVRCTAAGAAVPAVSTGVDGRPITSRSIDPSGSAASALLTKRSSVSPADLIWSPLSRKGGRGMGEGLGVRADRGSETLGIGAPESAPGVGVRCTADGAALPTVSALPGLKPWARRSCPFGAAPTGDASERLSALGARGAAPNSGLR